MTLDSTVGRNRIIGIGLCLSRDHIIGTALIPLILSLGVHWITDRDGITGTALYSIPGRDHITGFV
jgi:hypothetical protein